MKIIKTTGRFKEIINLSPTVKHFVVELNQPLDFKAGQFINFSFREGEELFRRPYSISSDPSNKNEIELVIKLVGEGKTTPIMFNKKIGFEFEVMGPLGMFTMENSKKDKIVFIGTGTGVGPLRSMLKDSLNNKIEKEFTLIFGVRNEEEIIYKDEFEKIESENPNFKFLPIVSRPSDSWTGRIGHVQDNFDTIDVLNSEVYICGLPQMVIEAKEKLIKLGMREEDIHLEKYA